MSEIFKISVGGAVPPDVATSYVTDTGTAVPAVNILNIKSPSAGVSGGITFESDLQK
jgi:hypothetical protein